MGKLKPVPELNYERLAKMAVQFMDDPLVVQALLINHIYKQNKYLEYLRQEIQDLKDRGR